MTKKIKNEEKLISLNDTLATEFSLLELEMRLETDPLIFASLVTEMAGSACTVPGSYVICNGVYTCATTVICVRPEGVIIT